MSSNYFAEILSTSTFGGRGVEIFGDRAVTEAATLLSCLLLFAILPRSMMRDDSRRPADRLSNLAKAMQKSKVKEEKETLKLLEKISKKVMKESNTTLLSEMEKKCREMVAKGILELKQELLMTENLNSTRISHMEAKLSTLTSKLDDISAEITKSADKISKENLELQNKLKELIEAERLKRITMVKKAQEKNHDHFTSIENSIQAVKGEHMGFIQDIRDDLRLQTKEVVQLKERLDHM
ncbi:hypothetical protein EON64_02330 [archaeon]|nr:MAG: hypothetical protein EON64_02330 [archaeon]